MRGWGPVLMVVTAAVVSVWPMVVSPSRVVDRGSDGWFLNWVINQQARIVSECVWDLGGCPARLFQGNAFYPSRNVLVYSDMFSISGFIAALARVMDSNPGAASGVTLVVGQVTTMLLVYLIWRDLIGNDLGAMIGTIALGLSQIRWEYSVHLQMWNMQYWLLGYWLISSSLIDKNKWKLYGGVLLLGLQMWESILPVYFAIGVLSTFIIYNLQFTNNYQSLNFKFLKHLILGGLIFGIIAWPVVRVYREVAREQGFVRSIRDAAHGGMSINDLWGQFASPGLYMLLAVALTRLRNNQETNSKRQTKFLLVIAVLGLVMALGPVLKWRGETVKIAGRYPIPLPYAAAYYVAPGMEAFRTPSRWIWVAGWGMSGLMAVGFANLKFSTAQLRNLVGLGGCLLVSAAGGAGVVKYVDLPRSEQVAVVYRWLANQPGEVVLQLPGGGDARESERMYYSLIHGKKLINGFSGFMPINSDLWIQKMNKEFPNDETMGILRELGVDYVILDKNDPLFKVQDKEPWNIIWRDEKHLVVGI